MVDLGPTGFNGPFGLFGDLLARELPNGQRGATKDAGERAAPIASLDCFSVVAP
jgi:hypothetical protein